MGERYGRASGGDSFAGDRYRSSGRTSVDRLRSADEFWCNCASAATSAAAYGIRRAGEFRVVVDAASVHERLCR
jgi:hypothetical protein